MPPDDEGLAKLFFRWIAGDGKAFEPLYHAFFGALFHYLLRAQFASWRRSSGLEADQAAQDIVDEAFLRALVKRDFESVAHLRYWLFATVRGLALHRLRSDRRLMPYDDADSHANDAGVCDASVDLAVVVLRELEHLPRHYADLIWLYYLNDYSYQQIASLTGLSVGSVYNDLTRGLNKVSARLNAKGYVRVVGDAAALRALISDRYGREGHNE